MLSYLKYPRWVKDEISNPEHNPGLSGGGRNSVTWNHHCWFLVCALAESWTQDLEPEIQSRYTDARCKYTNWSNYARVITCLQVNFKFIILCSEMLFSKNLCIFIWNTELRIEKEIQREASSICKFTPQMNTMPKLSRRKSQNLYLGSQVVAGLSLASPGTLTGSGNRSRTVWI